MMFFVKLTGWETPLGGQGLTISSPADRVRVLPPPLVALCRNDNAVCIPPAGGAVASGHRPMILPAHGRGGGARSCPRRMGAEPFGSPTRRACSWRAADLPGRHRRRGGDSAVEGRVEGGHRVERAVGHHADEHGRPVERQHRRPHTGPGVDADPFRLRAHHQGGGDRPGVADARRAQRPRPARPDRQVVAQQRSPVEVDPQPLEQRARRLVVAAEHDDLPPHQGGAGRQADATRRPVVAPLHRDGGLGQPAERGPGADRDVDVERRGPARRPRQHDRRGHAAHRQRRPRPHVERQPQVVAAHRTGGAAHEVHAVADPWPAA